MDNHKLTRDQLTVLGFVPRRRWWHVDWVHVVATAGWVFFVTELLRSCA